MSLCLLVLLLLPSQVNLQGLINLADNLVEDGGFQTVVGFHKHMAQWAETTKNSMGVRMMNRVRQDLVPSKQVFHFLSLF